MTRHFSTHATALVAALMVSVFAGEALAELSHTKTYTRNAFGAVTAVTETWGSADTDGIAATSRVTSYTYDAKVRHRDYRDQSAQPRSDQYAYDALHGLPAYHDRAEWPDHHLGIGFLRAGYQRNPRRQHGDPHIRYVCDGDPVCPTHAALLTVMETDGSPHRSKSISDKLYREIRKSTVALDGRTVHVDTEYDAIGRVARKSEPYFDGDTPLWTTITYDILGRPLAHHQARHQHPVGFLQRP